MRGCAAWKLTVTLSVLLTVMLGVSSEALAQAGTATLTGTVKDTQGGVVPGVTVTATQPATGASRNAVSGEQGVYTFPGLTPGVYTVKFELQGSRLYVREDVTLQVDSTAQVDALLSIGGLNEVITVREAAPIINATDASLGNVMSQAQIQQLPLEARNPVSLLSLQTGAVYLPTNDQRSGSVSGARSDQSNVTLDGIDVNDAQFSYAYTTVLRVTPESLQEFRVSTSNYTADMGRSSAAQVSLVTKSGTNSFNGAGYWSHRNTAWSSNEYFLKQSQLSQDEESVAPKLDKHSFGGAVGGPIKKDRFFFFGNYEGLREDSESPLLRNVPSATLRDGVLVYVCANPAQCPGGTVQGFSNTHNIPAGHYGLRPAEIAALDPLGIGPSKGVSDHFKQYPLPNDPGRDGINYMGYRFAAPLQDQFKTYTTRLDFRVDNSGNHKLFFRGVKQDDEQNGSPQFDGQPANTTEKNANWGVAFGLDSVVSRNMVNTFRYGLTKIDEAQVGLQDASAVSFRFITDFNALTATDERKVGTHNFVNDTSWLKGSHTVKFGTNLRFTRNPRSSNANSFHVGSLNPSWVNGTGRAYMPGGATCTSPACFAVPAVSPSFSSGFGDPWLTLLGVISQPTGNYNYDRDGNALPEGEPVRRKYAADEYEFYVQDSWRLNRT